MWTTATQLVKGQPGTGSAPSYEAAQYAVSRAKTYPSFVYNEGVLQSVQEDLGTSRTVEQLHGDLTASNPVGTPLLEITAAGTTPREAADKANSAAKHLALLVGLDGASWERTGRHGQHGDMTVELYETHVAAEEVDHLAQVARLR